MESHYLAEEEIKNVFDQLEYTDTKHVRCCARYGGAEVNHIEILPSRC